MRTFWIIGGVIVSVTCVGLGSGAQPTADLPSFIAECKDVTTHGYRSGKDMLGNWLPKTWSTDEKFMSDSFETFVYRRGEKSVFLRKINKNVKIAETRPRSLILVDNFWAPGASGVWVYAINFDTREIVAAEVRSGDLLGPSVMGRVVQLECRFTVQ